MSVFQHPDYDSHEKLVFHHDASSGLKAIIAIHNTNLGCALGGCRMWPYASDDEAIADVLRLSRGMTYKAAITGLNLGGGKAVIIGDPLRDKTPQRLKAMGRLVESLHGEYVTAEDVGIGEQDVAMMATETRYATGFEHVAGVSGDPSPYTAYGVFRGIEQAARFQLGWDTLAGIRVAIQGVGKVGYELARLLSAAGARVYAADIFTDNLKKAVADLGVIPVMPEDILRQPAEVFSPCAMGAVINETSLRELAAPVVAGSANNQLSTAEDGQRLQAAGILYVPDYVINAGGLIDVYYQYFGADRQEVLRHIDEMAAKTLPEIFQRSKVTGAATSDVADELARSRFMGGSQIHTDAA